MTKIRTTAAGMLLVAVIYALSAALIFDFKKPAYAFDQEYTPDGRQVAYGPCPRFCVPQGPSFLFSASFNGQEWPFAVYRPVCLLWLKIKRLAPPSEWNRTAAVPKT